MEQNARELMCKCKRVIATTMQPIDGAHRESEEAQPLSKIRTARIATFSETTESGAKLMCESEMRFGSDCVPV